MRIQLGEFKELRPFDFRWPGGDTEHFQRGWEGVVLMDGRELEIQHGLGRRTVYGRPRVHSVTWVKGIPVVEGVGTDDYASTGSLVSIIKRPDRHHVRDDKEIPPGYEAFTIVRHRAEIQAPHSPDCLAVKIVDSNLGAWAVHAALRASSLRKLGSKTRPPRRPHQATPGAEPTVARASPTDKFEIVRAILGFGEKKLAEPNVKATFTPDRDANQLILKDPFAFVLAVILDQGIPAERAWQAPYELKRRLGHLDPRRIVADPASVASAVKGPPGLHRFISKVSKWIVLAADRVVREYAGDVSGLWKDGPTAKTVFERLNAFAGIGQKKAAMAVEILARDLGVPIRALEGSDIAYDVHVRRVMLRTGLAQRDDPNHMVEVARRLYPERPGALDFPVWYIGRQWCHPGTPDCPNCVLSQVCPKEIYRASGVQGN